MPNPPHYGAPATGEQRDPYLARPLPDIAPVITRLRATLCQIGPQEDEPGALDELVAEIEEYAPLRKRANQVLGV